jgi:hypothetical protein
VKTITARAVIAGQPDHNGNVITEAGSAAMAEKAIGLPVRDVHGNKIGTIVAAKVDHRCLVIEVDMGSTALDASSRKTCHMGKR